MRLQNPEFLIKKSSLKNIEFPNERIHLIKRFENELLKSKNELTEALLKKISLEIHDNISPLLTLVKWNLSALDDSDNNHIKESKLYILEAIAALRTLSHTTNGDFILKEGLNAAVLKLSNSFNSLKHLTCSFENTIDFDIKLIDSNELIIYRCIQEILNNAVKHSGANEIKIIFLKSDYFFKVLITDNGKGFEPSNSQINGIGLKNIEDRIILINGWLDIQSIINKGTQITLSVPLTN
jgi:two-component system NarL family sensor kinase